jgi:hypothetical protein
MGSEWAATICILGVDTKKLLHFRRLKRLLKNSYIILHTSLQCNGFTMMSKKTKKEKKPKKIATCLDRKGEKGKKVVAPSEMAAQAVENYASVHPGGPSTIRNYVSKDASKMFPPRPPAEILQRCLTLDKEVKSGLECESFDEVDQLVNLHKKEIKEEKKKKKKKKKKNDKGGEGGDKAQKSEVEAFTAASVAAAVDEKTETTLINEKADAVSNDVGNGGWSWEAAFAAATKVQPDDSILDDDFIKATIESEGNEEHGVIQISRLAKAHKIDFTRDGCPSIGYDTRERNPKRKQSEYKDESHSTNSGEDSLEFRMAHVASHDGENVSSPVLMHKKSGKVCSAGARTQDGSRLVIGTAVKRKIELDRIGVNEMKRLEESGTLAISRPAFPYPTNPDDHCETPLQSYKDILPILTELCKSDGSLKIYDPYFCDGSVVKHLSSLGFDSVYNKKEDCYAIWELNSEPRYDVLLTNPPYSEDHLEKLMNHVTSPSFDKPWLLLMPHWVHKKDYYVNATANKGARHCNPFYVVPHKRYVYLPPPSFREKKDSDVHKKSSPFVSMWYCWGGNEKRNEKMMNAFRRSAVSGDCDLARSRSALRDLRRSGSNGHKGKRSKTNPN